MPPVQWTVEPVTVVNAFVKKHGHPEKGALILFGVWAVDSLHYLREIDARDDLSEGTINGYGADVIDVAHTRWATGTCITVLDTCAAGLGRVLCNHNDKRELSVADFTLPVKLKPSKPTRAEQLRPMLPAPVLHWIDGVINDADYNAVKVARNALTHGLVRRHFTIPRQRLDIQVGDHRMDVPTLVALSADVATRHVRALMELLPIA
jgi:hypothetical protein